MLGDKSSLSIVDGKLMARKKLKSQLRISICKHIGQSETGTWLAKEPDNKFVMNKFMRVMH